VGEKSRADIDARAIALHIVSATRGRSGKPAGRPSIRRKTMKLEWHKPEVVEEEVGLEVTSYASAELDRT
jgi:coenzyme PQQ precursor peptide PqqA